MRAMPSTALKAHNRNAMTQYLYAHKHATKQELERELGLSLPTITQNLRFLENDGIIRKGNLQDSTGGRKAQSYEFNADNHTSVGVVMKDDELHMCSINLYGKIIEEESHAIPYRNANAYYQRIGGIIDNFADKTEKKHGKVLGVAFAIQGILSPDGRTITFGTIMGNTGLTLDTICQSIHHPCMMIHDSDASAMTELWFDHTLTDAVCVYLERRPGGAVIVNGKLYQGPNQCNGTIEHMILVPNGRQCYCGQRGCMDMYCSLETLPEDYESIPGFFSVLEQGERHHRERMDEWLDYVTQAIVNARTIIAGDVIIGGEAAKHLAEDDIETLKSRIIQRSPFGTEHFTLRKSYCTDNQNIIGAALRFVELYLSDICGVTEQV
ncbi:NagC family Transcriptional regulator [Bifidobacterium saguini DSM 23967]|uniref:NagC family Transcriptional regulator n=2 Tax=Bifidobacterium saguini TaxID=762210 RepID=A0A087DAS1_9BIFI|nr:ROK family transcriptional regulator [Bifidobacterium saguini]KFI92621.1 NagC family Transcriptional regulator [Bifidobacterium saguini DSM 23967]QTB91633.1 ROK family transcriptional regulator [Bifidobacterium saguini]